MRQTKTNICKLKRSLVGKRNKKKAKDFKKAVVSENNSSNYRGLLEWWRRICIRRYDNVSLKNCNPTSLLRALEEGLSHLHYVNHQNVHLHGRLLSLAKGTLSCATFMRKDLNWTVDRLVSFPTQWKSDSKLFKQPSEIFVFHASLSLILSRVCQDDPTERRIRAS